MSGPPKVLIVEDHSLVAFGLSEMLYETGHEVVGVSATVSDALVVAANTEPDVAVVDVRLAGRRDGVEGAQVLRQQFGLAVVFLTAQTDAETKQRAASVNPASYLQKPVHSEELVQAIRSAVGKEE